jgi:hypothetical protein
MDSAPIWEKENDRKEEMDEEARLEARGRVGTVLVDR